jgi:hypothetical protein
VSVRARFPAIVGYAVASVVTASFSGLAGPLSSAIAFLPPAFVVASTVHLILSWHSFRFHQSFSNDHPQKGDIVRYRLSMSNESPIPPARGICAFSAPGTHSAFRDRVEIPANGNESKEYETELRCFWRGTYTFGLRSISFRDSAGIFSVEEKIEPRVFYVYPELVNIGADIERLTRSTGFDKTGASAKEDDPSIFENLAPLGRGKQARRVAWKRWAATGTPAEIVTGRSGSDSLRVVLDLWPGYPGIEETEKLAAEDMATSAVFSVLRALVRERIPARLILGDGDRAVEIATEDDFNDAFARSTNILFTDDGFPFAAFASQEATLLVTTRPLDAETDGTSVFSALEESAAAGTDPHILACPPPGATDAERATLAVVAERHAALGGKSLIRLADARRGIEEITHALSV